MFELIKWSLEGDFWRFVGFFLILLSLCNLIVLTTKAIIGRD